MKKLKSKFALIVATVLLLAGAGFTMASVGLEVPGLWLIVVVALLLPFLSGGRQRCEGFVSWKEEYSVGVASIDEQHKKLLNLINNLRAAVLCDTGADFEQGALDELVAYTQNHLKYEEDLMQQHGYIDYEAHKGQHDHMIIQVDSYLKHYAEKGSEVLPEVAEYLQLWLLQHIKVTDRKLCDFLQTKNVG